MPVSVKAHICVIVLHISHKTLFIFLLLPGDSIFRMGRGSSGQGWEVRQLVYTRPRSKLWSIMSVLPIWQTLSYFYYSRIPLTFLG